MKKTWLPDVNFWLALAFQQHVHHIAAKNCMTAAPLPTTAFCRMTQQGFLRLATNRRIFGDETLSMSEAWTRYDELFDDPRVVYSEEPDGLEATWRSFTGRRTFSPKIWNDAYLAAFAPSVNFKLVTFDHDFAQFSAVDCVILT